MFKRDDRVEYKGEEYRIEGWSPGLEPPLKYVLLLGEKRIENVPETELQYAKTVRDVIKYPVGTRVQDPRQGFPGDIVMHTSCVVCHN